MAEEALNWDHTYLLGWYDREEKSYLSSWDGDNPRVDCVVVGYNHGYGPPIWHAPVPPRCVAFKMPADLVTTKDKVAYATRLGGVYAFGWYITQPIQRVRSDA